MESRQKAHFSTPLILLSLLLVSCAPSNERPPSPEISQLEPSPSSTIEPTRVVTPTVLVPRVLLIAPPSNPVSMVSSVEGALLELTSQVGFVFETQVDLNREDLDTDLRLVVILPPDPGIVDFASIVPEVQFLAIGIPGLTVSPNLSVIGPNGMASDHIGFIAGYVAAMVTPDWRVGVISRSDTPHGLAGLNGFLQGARYYCGTCRPIYPPYLNYPQFVGLTKAELEMEGFEAADPLIQAAVEMIYIDQTVDSESLLRGLAGKNVQLLGAVHPSNELRSSWIATIRVNPVQGIREIWGALLDDQGGYILPMPISFSEVNSDLISVGKMRLVEVTLQELQSGLIDSGVDPVSGILK